jgi:signal transduction histidine kinase
MRRIRILLILLFVGLAAPVAILVQRAVEGLAFESRLRQQSVAERAFDEMERELSVFLQSEEARPFGQYRFYDADGAGTSPALSPLARLPEHTFVVGYFQIDPDGAVHVPLRPRDLELARTRGHWPPSAETERTIARTEAIVRQHWPRRSAGRRDALLRQAPGSTLRLEDRAAQAPPEVAEAEADLNAYDALQSFNRALEGRSQRKQKIAEAPYAAVAGEAGALDAPARQPTPSELSARERTTLESEEFLAKEEGPREPASAAVAARAALLSEKKASLLSDDKVRVVLDPMVGLPLGDDLLLLYRSVSVAERSYRQGLVVDLAALGRTLDERILGSSRLRRIAAARFFGADAPEALARPDGNDAYLHRFAEPFDGLVVRLELEPLPGVGTSTPVYALALLVLVAGALGLLALDRMVAVVVHFAERRANFVASVSHELKTPLTAIRMYAEMLRDDLVSTEAKRREYYATISDESERLSRLIHNVLEFSSLERGKRDMQLAVGPVGPVLADAAEKLEPHAQRQGFELRVEVEPDLPAVRMDRDAMLQMLFNLLDNAFKYARSADRREVVLEARAVEGRVVVGVRDFGPGVPAAHLRRVFEPFYRGEDELTRSAKGSGIGLALVRDLAERMGAAVRGSNVAGGGFRVEICLDPHQA